MQRTTSKHDGFTETVTTNGVTTRTAAVMALDVAERNYDNFHPGSGINRELMLAVRDQITTNRLWWNQGVWRQVIETGEVEDLPEASDYGLGDDEAREAILSAIAFEVDATTPACGTAMCFAGWATEISRADWVLDAKAITAQRKAYDEGADGMNWSDLLANQLFVTKAWWDKTHPDWASEDTTGWGHVTNPWLAEHAKSRGFTPATHHVIMAMSYALAALGLDRGHDPYNLFEGSNTFEYVTAAATAYARMEVEPSSLRPNALDALLVEAALSLGYDPEDVVPEWSDREDDEDDD